MKKKTKQQRILVIDDQESIRKSLKVALEKKGYLVDTAKEGREAIQKSKRRFYNLALVDLRLPDMDGIQLLTAMKETTPKMIKIIITGYPSLENAIEAINRGADGYIVKPFKMEPLLKTIKEHLKRQQDARKYSEEKVKEFIQTRAEQCEPRASAKRRSNKWILHQTYNSIRENRSFRADMSFSLTTGRKQWPSHAPSF